MIIKTYRQFKSLKLGARGFNLAEIVVASAVIALMMVSLIGYVQSAGTLWQKSHATISLTNDANALLDYIERELWQADSISQPDIGDTTSTLAYAKTITDYQASPFQTDLDFQIQFDATTNTVSTEVIDTGARWASATATIWSVASNTGPGKIVPARHNFDICRNVINFEIRRQANKLLFVKVILSIPQPGQEDEREVELNRLMVMH